MYGDSGADKNYILSLNFQTLSFMLYLSTLCGEVGPPAFAVKKLYRIIALVEETKYGLEQYRYIHRVVGQ